MRAATACRASPTHPKSVRRGRRHSTSPTATVVHRSKRDSGRYFYTDEHHIPFATAIIPPSARSRRMSAFIGSRAFLLIFSRVAATRSVIAESFSELDVTAVKFSDAAEAARILRAARPTDWLAAILDLGDGGPHVDPLLPFWATGV